MSLPREDWLQDIYVLDLLLDQDRVSEGLLPGVPEGQHLQLLLIPVSVLMIISLVTSPTSGTAA